MKIDRVLANNPGLFTGPGTNTWILDDGDGNVAIIDPGPIDYRHESALYDRIADRNVTGILVTHTHSDHAPLANPLARNLGVGTLGFSRGPGFEPDTILRDGTQVPVGRIEMAVVYTPGHSEDHLCFRVGNVMFTGDHIMGGSSVMVEKMAAYLESLRKLQGTGLERLLPGHGREMDDPEKVIDWYLAHRLQRHQQIVESIEGGAGTTMEVVEDVYSDVDEGLYSLAERSVRAHLMLLSDQGRIALDQDDIVLLPPQTP